jgi:hypothetical protein
LADDLYEQPLFSFPIEFTIQDLLSIAKNKRATAITISRLPVGRFMTAPALASGVKQHE